MAPSIDQVLKVCEKLFENEYINLSVKQSAKGAGMAFGGSLLGGLLGGPPGLLIGGTLGSALGWLNTRGTFESIPYIINHRMNTRQRHQLAEAVQEVISNIKAEDAIALLAIISANPNMKAAILMKVKDFILSNSNRLT